MITSHLVLARRRVLSVLGAVLAALLAPCGATADEPVRAAKLGAKAAKAYEILKLAARFEDVAVGADGATPDSYESFILLLGETEADAAFKQLLREGKIAGQMYALCGLWFTDPVAFKHEVERYRTMDQMVETLMGCSLSHQQVSFFVDVSPLPLLEHEKVVPVRLDNNQQTIEQWGDKYHVDRCVKDIIGGGWAAHFKEYDHLRKTLTPEQWRKHFEIR